MRRRVILVTGGSGGIGQAICRLAARRGYSVALTYRNDRSRGDANAIVAEIKERGQAAAFKADLGTRKNVVTLFQRIEARLAPVCAVVTCAGSIPPQSDGLNISERRLGRVWRSNFAASFFCLQEAALQMIRIGSGGAIVTVSSHSAHTGGTKYHVDYAAMKAGIESITVGFARELAPHGIRVNAVSPGDH
jgi:NAD(P)-dependent dehydrogenase (short-subunit alcohol dehydrogenase family)